MTRVFALSLPIVVPMVVLVVVLAGCGRDAPAPGDRASTPSADQDPSPVPAEVEPVELKDVSETTSNYVIGISYPKSAMKYPALAALLKRYADDARNDLLEAVAASGEDAATMYDLSLEFTVVADTPDLFVVAADGSSYTGGAHSAPLLSRFVWLPRQGKRLSISDLLHDENGWKALSAQVREQLHTALSQRVDADDLPPAERARMMQSAGRMIDEGSDPDPDNFSQFEPVPGADGRVTALRFVFPPYQVGPYSDGTQTVQVPTSALLPHIAPEYRPLFEGG
jgi:hypothetical protein